MKLTRRQEEFIKKMIELGQELDGPVHYTAVAEQLGVSPFTAYDMLRLLEEKGFVTSEYQLASDKSGPGRATRLFYPTQKAQDHQRTFSEKAVGALELEGEELRQFLFEKIAEGLLPEEALGIEMLARIAPENESGQVNYCMEVMTVIVLRLKQSDGFELLSNHLPKILPEDTQNARTNLCLFGGFAFGILAEHDSSDQEWTDILFEHVQQYLKIIMQLSVEECTKLSQYIADIFSTSIEERFPAVAELIAKQSQLG